MTTAIDKITPITRRSDAAEVATGAYDDLIALVETLEGDDWRAQTECPGWNVTDVVGHLIGSAKAAASKRELMRQNIYGFRHAREYDGNAMDAYNALQVEEHASLTAAERVDALKAVAAEAVRGRMRTPAFLRAVSMAVKPNGSVAEGMPNKGNVGHLMDAIYTRDVFMHRIDIARAVGRDLSRGRTTAGSSKMPWLSGLSATSSPSRSSCPARPVGSSCRAQAGCASRWTLSTLPGALGPRTGRRAARHQDLLLISHPCSPAVPWWTIAAWSRSYGVASSPTASNDAS